MPIREKTLERSNDLLQAISIGNRIVANSNSIDPVTKDALTIHHNWMETTVKTSIENESLTAAGLKSLIDAFLIFWNESISVEAELFWNELQLKQLSFERKDPFKAVLRTGRFRNVHQGIAARKNWAQLRQSGYTARFSPDELEEIEDAIRFDEESRFVTLSTRLQSKKLSKRDYLWFQESMAYFTECHLWESYFTTEERDQLKVIGQSVAF